MATHCEPNGRPATQRLDDIAQPALEAWLGANVAGFAGPLAAEKFAGGQSNPTYRIDAASGRYVLRRKPSGPILPSAHAIEREYRLIAALHPAGFPVPRPLALCEDAGVIGAPFYVMELIAGRTFWDGTLPDQPPADRRAIYEALIGTLAQLHAIDPGAVGLADYGPPGNYFERQVRRWTRQYRAAQTDDLPDVDRLIAWLPATLPAQDRVAIIHGDYRIDNLIFAPDRPQVAAVLDWELSTLGDPLADFAYLAMNWAMPAATFASGIGGADLAALSIPTLEEATARYCALTGRGAVPQLDWYFAYNLFRLLGIVQGIKKRVLDGNASNAQAERMAQSVVPLAAQAWAFARRAGAPR